MDVLGMLYSKLASSRYKIIQQSGSLTYKLLLEKVGSRGHKV